jgi:5'-3' exonuclease
MRFSFHRFTYLSIPKLLSNIICIRSAIAQRLQFLTSPLTIRIHQGIKRDSTDTSSWTKEKSKFLHKKSPGYPSNMDDTPATSFDSVEKTIRYETLKSNSTTRTEDDDLEYPHGVKLAIITV